jgi:hypothetical protein
VAEAVVELDETAVAPPPGDCGTWKPEVGDESSIDATEVKVRIIRDVHCDRLRRNWWLFNSDGVDGDSDDVTDVELPLPDELKACR